MTSFASREAMTTAEPPEPLDFQHPEFILFKQFLQQIVGPAARHLCVLCVLWLKIRVHSCAFVVLNQWISNMPLWSPAPVAPIPSRGFHRFPASPHPSA